MGHKVRKGLYVAAAMLAVAFFVMLWQAPQGVYAAGEDKNYPAEKGVATDVPLLIFTIDETQGTIAAMNESEDHSVSCSGLLDIVVPEGFQSEYMKEAPESLTGLEVERLRGRGNSTWSADKKPYSIRLSKKTDLFGMGKSKHWALLADYFDNSHLRNRISYRMGADLGMPYVPQCIPVEVVMNGEYYGTYTLAEQVRVEESRVDIDELAETDTELPVISGGYLLSLAPYGEADSRSTFTTDAGVEFENHTPDFVEYDSEVQQNYIRDYIQKTEDAILGEGFKDAEGHSYTEYMDMDSAVDFWLFQELTLNSDAYVTDSTHLFKERDGKLFWGPIWDFDYVAWGDLEYGDDFEDGYERKIDGFNHTPMVWFDRLKDDPAFIKAVKDRWPAFKEELTEITKEGGILDQYYEEQKASQENNLDLWGHHRSPMTDYRSEVEQLRTWIRDRVAWIEANFDALDDLLCDVTFMADGQVVEVRRMPRQAKRVINPPEAPEKEGYVFDGWYVSEEEHLRRMQYIDGDTVIEAHYRDKSTMTRAKEIFLQAEEVWMAIEEEQYIMCAGVYPLDAELRDITWTSSDETIATVDSFGVVIPQTTGDVTITATLESGASDSLRLHIVSFAAGEIGRPTAFTVDTEEMQLTVGEYRQLVLTYEPKACVTRSAFQVENSEIAQVDDVGVIIGIAPGTTYVAVGDALLTEPKLIKVTVVEAPSYSSEWVDGLWYEKDGSQTYKGVGVWKKDATGWYYMDSKGWYPKNRWQKIDGKWYFFDRKGYMESDAYRDGFYLKKNGAWDGRDAVPGWKFNGISWRYSLGSGRFLKSTWMKIDGKWYYFKTKGYPAKSEFVGGYWINKNFIQSDPNTYSWHRSGKKWWYGNKTWYAKDTGYVIDGRIYTFDAKGYFEE